MDPYFDVASFAYPLTEFNSNGRLCLRRFLTPPDGNKHCSAKQKGEERVCGWGNNCSIVEGISPHTGTQCQSCSPCPPHLLHRVLGGGQMPATVLITAGRENSSIVGHFLLLDLYFGLLARSKLIQHFPLIDCASRTAQAFQIVTSSVEGEGVQWARVGVLQVETSCVQWCGRGRGVQGAQ